jgi:hypothetical protein
MRKPKKNTQNRKKALDTFPRKKAQSGRGGARSRRFASSVFEVDGHNELTGKSLSWPLELAIPEKRKRGRPTIADNFLLGSRNSWLHFFEEAWPEIGLSLLNIRKDPSRTIEHIQRVFEPVQSKDNCDHGKAFLRGLPQPIEGEKLRRNRTRNADLFVEIQKIQSQLPELRRSCEEAEEALKHVSEEEHQIIQKELTRRRKRLLRLEETLGELKTESKELNERVLGQETYWYCSQLRDFLCGKKQYAVKPLKLANALAGLPDMGWRGSLARCSRMPRSFPERLPSRLCNIFCGIWRRRPKGLRDAPTEFFRIQVLKLPKNGDGIRETLCCGLRDLRLAIVECWAQHSEDYMPYAITLAFLRRHRSSKTEGERILDRQEMLSSSLVVST